jgi:hypothetical protein
LTARRAAGSLGAVSLRILAALVLALALSSAPTAEAHRGRAPITTTADVAALPVVPDPPPVLRDAAPVRVSPWLVAAALGGAIALRGLGRSRAARRWALLLLFVSFTAEIGVHAVHHLSDPRGGADCYALSLGQHLSAAPASAPHVGAVGWPVALLPALDSEPAASTARAPDRGRAPPALAA